MATHPKKLGLPMATIVNMNAMIGAGIFGAVPAALGSIVGPAGIITYIFVTIAVYFMGQSFARLAQLYPQEGSFYVYASKWGGHWMGLISAGAYFIGLTTAMGLITQITASYLHVTFPTISPYVLGIITLTAITLLNMIGVHLSKIGQIILIILTIMPMIVIMLICFSHGNFANFFPFAPYGWSKIFTATGTVIFTFFGFEASSSLFNIVENPSKNVPRALVYSIILVGILYLLFVASIIYAVPLQYLSENKPLSEILYAIFKYEWLINFIYFSILIALLGTLHSMIWSLSELLLAYLMNLRIPTLNKLIMQKKINQRWTVLITGLAIFFSFATIKSLALFFNITTIFIVFAFITSIITLLTLKSEWRSKQNIKTIIGLLTAFIILYFAVDGIIVNL